MPKTGLGKWAGGLLVAFLVFAAAVILGTTRLGLQAGTPGLVILGICMMITGLAAFVKGSSACLSSRTVHSS